MAFFSKLRAAVTPKSGMKSGSKLSNMFKQRKIPSMSISKPKSMGNKKMKDFDFSKFTKKPKLPKAAKVTAIKKAIKKVKNVGF